MSRARRNPVNARRRSPGQLQWHLDRLPAELADAPESERIAAAETAKSAYFRRLANAKTKADAARRQLDPAAEVAASIAAAVRESVGALREARRTGDTEAARVYGAIVQELVAAFRGEQ